MADSDSTIVTAFLSYKEVLIRALLRLSVRPEDVDDILQESLTRALKANEKKRIEFPKSYLYTVSRNIVFEESERRSREVQREIDDSILESGAASLEEALHHTKMMEVFWKAMGTLPRTHQRAILLRRVYGFSHKEIAKKMGVSVSSVEKYFAQGIKRCHDVMSGGGYSIQNGKGGADRRKGANSTPEVNRKEGPHG